MSQEQIWESGYVSMKKILIVDDEPGIRELVEITLKVDEYEIFKAASGQEAIEISKHEKPDLTLMDIKMPGAIDGLEATRILKGDPETQNGTIIILSGKAEPSERKEGFDAGADAYFAKPFSPLALIRKVEEMLG